MRRWNLEESADINFGRAIAPTEKMIKFRNVSSNLKLCVGAIFKFLTN